MEILRSLLESPSTALQTAARAVQDAKAARDAGDMSEIEFQDIVKTATDLEAIDADMLSLEEKQALQDLAKAFIAVGQAASA